MKLLGMYLSALCPRPVCAVRCAARHDQQEERQGHGAKLMAVEMPRPGRTVHCSLQPAGFGLLKGLVSSVDEGAGRVTGSQARRLTGPAPNPMLRKPNARQFITSAWPPVSPRVFLEAF